MPVPTVSPYIFDEPADWDCYVTVKLSNHTAPPDSVQPLSGAAT